MATVLARDLDTRSVKLFLRSPRVSAADGVQMFRQRCDTLVQTIDVLLTAVHVLATMALAGSLVATAAGLVLSPP